MVSRTRLIGSLALVAGAYAGGCAEATTAAPGDGIADPGSEGEGEAAPGDPGPKPPADGGGEGGAGGGGGGDGGVGGGGDDGAPDDPPPDDPPPGDDDSPCEYRDDGLFVCGPDWLIVNLADGATVREAALPPGSVAVVQGAAGVDSRDYRFVRLGKPGGVDPSRDEAAGLARTLWEDAFAPALGEDGGAEVTEERSEDGTRLSWKVTSQDVRYGVMYVLRGGVATAKTLIPPRTGGLGVTVDGLPADGRLSLPIRPLPEALMVQWAGTKSLLCPGLAPPGAERVDGLLADARYSADHKLLALLDLLDAVQAVLDAAAPAEAAGCIRDHVGGTISATLGAIAPQELAAEDLIGTIAGVLDGALGQENGRACLGGGPVLLPALAKAALGALGSVTELPADDVFPGGCEHGAVAGFRAEIELPFEEPECLVQEECGNGYDDDCSGAADDDPACDCDADRYVPYCDGDELRERNGCGDSRALRQCDHGCRDGACEGCQDPTYDPYCDFGTDELWEENDCGTLRFVRECEFGCERGECQPCRDPNYDRYCDGDEVWERNDCDDERRVTDCEFGCERGQCEDCEDPTYDRFCHDGGDLWERNDCGDERGIANCACGCLADGNPDCRRLTCEPNATRCEDDVQETCIGGCGWDGPANCACGCAANGRACEGVPAPDGETALDREGNDGARTERQGNAWLISGAGRVGEVWSDGHDDVILITGYAQEGDDDWYYLVVDDGAFGSLQPRVLLEPPATTDLDLRVAYLNNEDRDFDPNCDVGRSCQGIAGHHGCCSTLGAGQDDEVRFNAETGLGDENSGVLLIRVQSFRTPNICDHYSLWVWL